MYSPKIKYKAREKNTLLEINKSLDIIKLGISN